ncbi:hypothetical protein [Kutzneria buriramensis]|uniref:Pyridoxamine 5'-phosphate oxidase family protein n=1 Tax=Kutzneria buriramensis TaxID=1045776 RepID=A0A3E0G797_9PSEU|nr:hypothetical protein [Kutzneria buriramensis]REH17829.1 pyridoxamine 5'-phosphate oxidase family protein [Kutzneria buriramensis]
MEIRGEGEVIDSAWAADRAQTGFDGAVIRIHPKRFISFGIDEANSDVTDYKVKARTVA